MCIDAIEVGVAKTLGVDCGSCSVAAKSDVTKRRRVRPRPTRGRLYWHRSAVTACGQRYSCALARCGRPEWPRALHVGDHRQGPSVRCGVTCPAKCKCCPTPLTHKHREARPPAVLTRATEHADGLRWNGAGSRLTTPVYLQRPPLCAAIDGSWPDARGHPRRAVTRAACVLAVCAAGTQR